MVYRVNVTRWGVQNIEMFVLNVEGWNKYIQLSWNRVLGDAMVYYIMTKIIVLHIKWAPIWMASVRACHTHVNSNSGSSEIDPARLILYCSNKCSNHLKITKTIKKWCVKTEIHTWEWWMEGINLMGDWCVHDHYYSALLSSPSPLSREASHSRNANAHPHHSLQMGAYFNGLVRLAESTETDMIQF